MNKFDAILSDICEANGYPNQQPANNGVNQQPVNNNGQVNNTSTNGQQPNTTTNQQQANNNAQQNTANSQQQKVDYQKLMADFNSNTVNIKDLKDFEKYGLKIS